MTAVKMSAADFSVTDRVVIVTGAGAGIGRAMAVELGAAGALVVCADVNEEAVRAVAAEIGASALAFRCDVRKEDQVEKVVSETMAKWGKIDGLINNAGAIRSAHVIDQTVEDWSFIFDVNVLGTFLFTRAVLPHMKSRKSGRIINMTSALGVRSTVGAAAYGASKAAVSSFTNTLHQEVADHGIRVSAIAPGLTNTALASASLSEDYMQRIAAQYPGGRLGQPDDIAGLAHFLISSASEHISGSVIFVRPPGG